MGDAPATFISLAETARITDQLRRLFLSALDVASGLGKLDHSSPEAVEARVALAVCARSLAEFAFAAEELLPVTVPPLEFDAAQVASLSPGLSISARAAFLLDHVLAPLEEIRSMVLARGRPYRDGNLSSFLRDASGVVAECRARIEPLTMI
ncbi:MAG: hypothetical protein M0Z47_10650 [Actinomycetota bacterium]|nr:hypothetical protein [Actinomycetota bacterium]